MGAPHEIIDSMNYIARHLPAEVLKPGMTWQELAQETGVFEEMDPSFVSVIEAWPVEMRDVLVTVFASAARTGAALRFAWSPHHDFRLTLAKANFADAPEYTVLLGSKYPDEFLAVSP